MLRIQLGAIALLAACALPLAANAQSAADPVAPAFTAPAVPGGPDARGMHGGPAGRMHHHADRFQRALAHMRLTPGQERQIAALLTPAQQARLRAALARPERPARTAQ